MKTLTEQQQVFLDAFVGEAQGDPIKAKEIAGYPVSTSIKSIMDSVETELIKAARDLITTASIKAYYNINSVMDDPTQLGGKEKLAAAKDILDRAGFKAADQISISSKETPVFMIPPKKPVEIEDEEKSNH